MTYHDGTSLPWSGYEGSSEYERVPNVQVEEVCAKFHRKEQELQVMW